MPILIVAIEMKATAILIAGLLHLYTGLAGLRRNILMRVPTIDSQGARFIYHTVSTNVMDS